MRRHLVELVLFSTYAELRAETARSYLGLLWWILDPAMMMAAFWLVFDVILKTGGPDYIPFLLVGITLWQWMKSCITHGGYAIWSNLPMVRQVPLPPLVFPLVAMLSDTVKFCFIFVLLVAISLILIWFFRTDLGLAVRATGQNETMIQSLGVDVDKTKMVGLALSNGLIALSGALIAQNHAFADIGMGIGILVAGAAAVLIGEALFGDRSVGWWVFAAIVGSLIYQFLVAAALRVGLNANDLKLATAALLLAALALPRLRLRGGAR